MRADQNERVRIAEIRGLASEDVRGALREMDALASGTRCTNYFYHANLNPRAEEHLTGAQWEQAVDTLERELKLDGHSRFIVEHEKDGRTHQHVIWSRIDPQTMRAVSDSNNYAAHERAARALEQAFEHERVRGVHVDLDGNPRPARRPENWEVFRGHESGLDPQAIKAEVSALWRDSNDGKAFAQALADAGYILAKGDRRDFCLVDTAGDEHSLARRIDGAKAAEIRARMADVDRETLPSVAEARALAQAKQIVRDAAARDGMPSAEIAAPRPAPSSLELEAAEPRPVVAIALPAAVDASRDADTPSVNLEVQEPTPSTAQAVSVNADDADESRAVVQEPPAPEIPVQRVSFAEVCELIDARVRELTHEQQVHARVAEHAQAETRAEQERIAGEFRVAQEERERAKIAMEQQLAERNAGLFGWWRSHEQREHDRQATAAYASAAEREAQVRAHYDRPEVVEQRAREEEERRTAATLHLEQAQTAERRLSAYMTTRKRMEQLFANAPEGSLPESAVRENLAVRLQEIEGTGFRPDREAVPTVRGHEPEAQLVPSSEPKEPSGSPDPSGWKLRQALIPEHPIRSETPDPGGNTLTALQFREMLETVTRLPDRFSREERAQAHGLIRATERLDPAARIAIPERFADARSLDMHEVLRPGQNGLREIIDDRMNALAHGREIERSERRQARQPNLDPSRDDRETRTVGELRTALEGVTDNTRDFSREDRGAAHSMLRRLKGRYPEEKVVLPGLAGKQMPLGALQEAVERHVVEKNLAVQKSRTPDRGPTIEL